MKKLQGKVNVKINIYKETLFLTKFINLLVLAEKFVPFL